MALEEDADNYPAVSCPAWPSVPCSQRGGVFLQLEKHTFTRLAWSLQEQLCSKECLLSAWDKKESPGSGRVSCFLFQIASFRTGLLSQSPTRHLAEPAPQPGQAGFAQGAMETWGMVFVGSGDAPGLAELGLALSEPYKWCLSQGSTPHCQTLEFAPLAVITTWVSHLAVCSFLLCASVSEV